ncbi:hypothetical protein ASE00_01550 [Sphingomonas sp. Root710]|uniref:hypothetical protein n=1 Tax=Sphingomonas sp. Root710 TaxID=1736594 RepID=UPI0006F24C61|nr:hypothetical protein [Sphingomonas sp. Root710]KRB85509.1 hypothetical protein ASE00_01550 [Sphingomonas sp. Root710]
MIISIAAALLASVAAEPAGSAAAAPMPATPAKRTVQQDFDAASRAIEEGRYEEGVKTFEAIEQRAPIQRDPIARGTLLARKGIGLMVLDRLGEAQTALTGGLKLIAAERSDLLVDRFRAQHALGQVALKQLNYAAAADAFGRSLALAYDNSSRIRALTALSRATAFDAGDASVRYAEQALAIARAEPDQAAMKRMIAGIDTLRGRALLNHGRAEEAYEILQKAMEEQGGLDRKVDADEIITRSDLAIAALLTGREDAARRYLAFTGAGRIAETPFETPTDMRPPSCGGPADLKPDDVAVVEFSIRDDGSVGVVAPIYASVNGQGALVFADAVRNWSWQPENVARIPPLFRLVTRVELRCSTGADRPPISQLLSAAFMNWAASLPGGPPRPVAGEAAALVSLKAELARREASGGGITLLPVLAALGRNDVAPRAEREAWLIRARDLTINARGPVTARVAMEAALAELALDWTKRGNETYRTALRTILARPEVGADAIAANTLKLMISDPLYRSPAPADASTLLREVTEDPRLSTANQLRIGALVRLATLQAASDNLAAAAASYDRTGLDTKQCALLDAEPVRRAQGNLGDFPMEAMRWGFEGWVRTEYDILPDGKTSAQRAIIAYPPFVFRQAALSVAKNVSYAKSYRPDGSAGCGGMHLNIGFRLPALRH